MEKRCHDCALSIAQELELCSLYKSGLRSYALAERFGVSQSSVMRTLRAYSVAISRKLYTYDESFFDTIDTEEKAYFLGLLTADGYVVNNKRRYVVQLTLCDKELVEALRSAIGGNQPIYEVDMSKWRGRPAFMLAIGSKKMVESLARYGVVQRKSKVAQFTDYVPDALIHHYMRGLFDGDGHCGTYEYRPGCFRTIFAMCGSEHIIYGFTHALHRILGVRVPAISYSGGRFKCIYSHRRDLSAIVPFFYRDARVFLARKRAVLSPFVERD
jgi:hypothetical protein